MEISEIPHQSNPHQTLSPAPALQLLKPFVGIWQVAGQNLIGAPVGADAEVTGEQHYEWFPGSFFLVNRWERHFDDGSHLGLGMISYNPTTNSFSSVSFDNLGYSRSYKLYPQQNAWKFDGSNERATIEFSQDGQSYAEYWEISENGTNWTPLCRLEGQRI